MRSPGPAALSQPQPSGPLTSRLIAPLLIAAFTLAYFPATVNLARLAPLTVDEQHVYYIAQLPSVADIPAAWLQSGDGMPPVIHFAVHFTGAVLGFSPITARVPPMLAFWAMCLCIFVFLYRRIGPFFAALGMILPLTIPGAYPQAYNVRGYGLVVGLVGAAVLCWDLTRAARWRRVALLGLPFCLAAAIVTHLYAVLAIAPFAAAELARARQRRRFDWPVWVGLLAPIVVLTPLNPSIAHIRDLREVAINAHWASVSDLLTVWSEFLSTAATYLGLLAIAAWARPALGRAGPLPRFEPAELPDRVLVLGLIALPAIAWCFANLATGNFMVRYVVVTVIGFSLGVPLLCRSMSGDRAAVAAAMMAWVALCAGASIATTQRTMRTTALTTEHINGARGCYRLLRLANQLPAGDLPIVVADFNVFHLLHQYAPPALRSRLVFVVDHQFGQLIEPAMPLYRRVFGERMEGLDPFLEAQHTFYVYDCGSPGRLPLLERLLDRGATVAAPGLDPSSDIQFRRDLYRVSMPGSSPASSG